MLCETDRNFCNWNSSNRCIEDRRSDYALDSLSSSALTVISM